LLKAGTPIAIRGKIGKLENWKAGKLENWKAGKLKKLEDC
jgi:hypothetical protein